MLQIGSAMRVAFFVVTSAFSTSSAFRVALGAPAASIVRPTGFLGQTSQRSQFANLHMKQTDLGDFDDERQYSMDSLSFSNTVGVPRPDSLEELSRRSSSTPSLADLKLRVLITCSGLDRGSAADSEERYAVERAVEELEKQSSLAPKQFRDLFDGKWRLVYTSALSPGSESGGGAGANSLPIFQTPAPAASRSFGGRGQVGQVYQDVQVQKGQLDNVVEVNPLGPLPLGKTTLTLEHKLDFVDGSPQRCKITLVNVAVDGPLKQLGLQPIRLPVLEAISSQGAGVFDTSFCDGDLRIARGDRGELRVFVKC